MDEPILTRIERCGYLSWLSIINLCLLLLQSFHEFFERLRSLRIVLIALESNRDINNFLSAKISRLNATGLNDFDH